MPLLIFETIDRLMDATCRIWVDLSFAFLIAKAGLQSISSLSRADGLNPTLHAVATVAISIVAVGLRILRIILSDRGSSDGERRARSGDTDEKFTHDGSPWLSGDASDVRR